MAEQKSVGVKVLFISWDGAYVSYLDGLFLPILSRLSKLGFEFHILHFSWAGTETVARIKESAKKANVPYRHIAIPRWPFSLGKLLTLFRGPKIIREYVQSRQIGWLMPRTMMPARMTIEVVRKLKGLHILFDADGLPIEERVDFAGLKPGGLRYRMLKRIERTIITKAAIVLVRSNRAIEILTSQYGQKPYFKVINGREENLFVPASSEKVNALRADLGIPRTALVIAYSGSLGKPYCIEEMVRLHKMILSKRPDSWLVILTGNPAAWPSSTPNTIVRSVAPTKVPAWLSIADVALALRRPTVSMQGVAPIKLGEYLLCGLPVIASGGIGDTDDLLGGKPFCHILPSLNDIALAEAATWSLTARKDTSIREFGIAHFGLEAAVSSYKRALTSIVR